MNFLLDHDVPDDAAFSLEALSHTVVKLCEVLPVTAPDDEVLRLAGERDCVLSPATAMIFWLSPGASRTTASSSSSAASPGLWSGLPWSGSWILPGNWV